MEKKKPNKPQLSFGAKFRNNQVKYVSDVSEVSKCVPKMVGKNLVVGKHVLNTRDF
jgi:hypothetical protein